MTCVDWDVGMDMERINMEWYAGMDMGMDMDRERDNDRGSDRNMDEEKDVEVAMVLWT